MTTITVKAAPGLRVPYEDNARKYITDDKAVAVEDSIYYLRRLADDELIRVEAQASTDQVEPPLDKGLAPAAPVDPLSDPATQPDEQARPADAASARATKRKGA